MKGEREFGRQAGRTLVLTELGLEAALVPSTHVLLAGQLAASGAEPQSLDMPGSNSVPWRRGGVLIDDVSPTPGNLSPIS